MVSVEHIAAWVESRDSGVSPMKLQKLLYYAQAWHLVWEGVALFPERIEAWVQGPVSPHVYGRVRHDRALATAVPLPADVLSTLEAIFELYGRRSGDWLSELTHREAPWRQARAGLASDERSKAEIPLESMRVTYGAHRYGEGKTFSAAYQRGLDLMVELPIAELSVLSETVDAAAALKALEAGSDE